MLPRIYIKIISFGQTAQEVNDPHHDLKFTFSLSLSPLILQDSYNSFFLNTNKQVDLACQLLSSDAKLSKGFNAMGFSQGSQLL